jgi:hypothetical protein
MTIFFGTSLGIQVEYKCKSFKFRNEHGTLIGNIFTLASSTGVVVNGIFFRFALACISCYKTQMYMRVISTIPQLNEDEN